MNTPVVALRGVRKTYRLGTHVIPALQGVDRIISHEMKNGDQLSFVYRQGTTLRHARFSIVRFQLDSDREILNVAQK